MKSGCFGKALMQSSLPLPNGETVLQEGDLVHVMLREDTAAQAESAFAAGPTAGSEMH